MARAPWNDKLRKQYVADNQDIATYHCQFWYPQPCPDDAPGGLAAARRSWRMEVDDHALMTGAITKEQAAK